MEIRTQGSYTLVLTKAELRQLENIMGYDLSVPAIVASGDDDLKAVTQFMRSLHTLLRGAL